ncbi:hypothetical protein CsSME_00046397 [Camellia sinensis var. sinensis]
MKPFSRHQSVTQYLSQKSLSEYLSQVFCLSLSLCLIAEAATRIARLLPPADKRARKPRRPRASPSCPAHLLMNWARFLMARLLTKLGTPFEGATFPRVRQDSINCPDI